MSLQSHFVLYTDNLDNLDPDNLQLGYVVQDLYSTDPQPRKHVLDNADYAAPTRQRELYV